MRKHLLETMTLVVAAAICAIVANALAARERKVALPGNYPNALTLTPRGADPLAPQASPSVPATETTAPVNDTTMTIAPATATTATLPATTGSPSVTTTTARATTAPAATAPSRPAIDVARFKSHPDKAYIEISGDDVAALHGAGALFLDARRSAVYEQGHIAGSRSLSVWESDIDDKVNALYEERSSPEEQNRPIVIYCSGGDCEDSHMLAQKLWGLQFNNIYVYKDGFPDWQKRGGAVRTGSNR